MGRAKGAGGQVARYAVRLFLLWLRMARKLFDPSHVPGDLGKSGLRNFGKYSFHFWKLFLGSFLGLILIVNLREVKEDTGHVIGRVACGSRPAEW